MNLQDAILELLIAAAPAIILYFTGWSYLYFYLSAFDIGIGEINLDLPTIFIYAYPPLRMLWQFYWGAIVAIIVGVVLAWLFGPRLGRAVGTRWPTPRLAGEFAVIAGRLRALSATVWTLVVLVVLVFILPVPLKSLTAWAAAHAADRVWDEEAAQLTPVIDKAPVTSRFDLFRVVTLRLWETATKRQTLNEALSQDYDQCAQRQATSVIFAVEQRYYLLCRGAQVPFRGAVFEVKGKEGLLSVRYVGRAEARRPR